MYNHIYIYIYIYTYIYNIYGDGSRSPWDPFLLDEDPSSRQEFESKSSWAQVDALMISHDMKEWIKHMDYCG